MLNKMDNDVIQQDTDILIRCKQGDVAAFSSLVDNHQNYAYTLAFRLLCNEDDARDAVQESFIRVWRHISKYNFRAKFTTWLYRIVTNICLDKIKARSRARNILPYSIDDLSNKQFQSDENMEKSMTIKDFTHIVSQLVEELNEKQRIVFTLRDLQDLSIEDVASITRMSKNSVKSNLYYARRNIRNKLENMNIKRDTYNEM